MPKFNPDKIAFLVSEMRKALSRIKSLANLEKSVFLNDLDKIGSAKYNFIIAIESAIDICNHIISQNGYRVPKDYGDTFQVLSEQGIFDQDFLRNLKDMARFRNRLIHLYGEADDEKVYEFMKTRLNDFKKFLEAISEFLEFDRL